jgi:hypothetical protein
VTSFLGHTKEYLKGMGFAEEEKMPSVPFELVREILPGMILRVYSDWDRRPRCSVLMKGEYTEQSFNLNWFLTGLDIRARTVWVLNVHPVRAMTILQTHRIISRRAAGARNT